MGPRDGATGEFRHEAGTAYDPRGAFEEGTPLQYLFMVPADVEGLTEAVGGGKALAGLLDDYFLKGTVDNPTAQPDLLTGNLGAHCQGNEPGHHVPYPRPRRNLSRPQNIRRRGRGVAATPPPRKTSPRPCLRGRPRRDPASAEDLHGRTRAGTSTTRRAGRTR